MPAITLNLSDAEVKKLRRLKEKEGLGDKTFEDLVRHLIRGVSLYPTEHEIISKATQENLAQMWAENLVLNLPSIVDLPRFPESKEERSIGLMDKLTGHSAIVIGAGPSIYAHDHLQTLVKSGYEGVIMSTDRMLIPLLREGINPDSLRSQFYVVTVDGNREKIESFYDDPLVDIYGRKITGLFAATGSPNAAKRLLKAGGTLRWFIGMLDSFYISDSVTGWMNWMLKLTAISCMGNTGAACWNLAHYLGCDPVILIGMDLGYRSDTPLEETAYYQTMKEAGLNEQQILSSFNRGYNPDFDVEYTQDMVFRHYNEYFMDNVLKAGITTINATEGGSIHGPGITGMTLEEALRRYPR